MLDPLSIYPVMPAADLERARVFYREKFGLEPTLIKPGMLAYSGPPGYLFQLYESTTAGTSEHTQMGFSTFELDADMALLRSKGIVFEEYDLPGLKTVDGVAILGEDRSAWFKDSEGNIICVSETVR